MRDASILLAAIMVGGCATNPPGLRSGSDASVLTRGTGVFVTPPDFEASRLADQIACESAARPIDHDSFSRTDVIELTGANRARQSSKATIFGFRACDGTDVRLFNAPTSRRTYARALPLVPAAHCPHSLRFTELHMLHNRTMLNLLATAAISIASPVIAQQPGMMQGTQQQHMQQHVTQMQDMMGRMSDMSQRSLQMQQQMKQQMGQMQGGQMGAAQMAMPQMADHMSAMTTQMKGLMGQMQTMMKDPLMMKDGTVQHDMDDMQGHMEAMSKDMGKMLQTMEQVQKHMAPQPKKP